MKKQNLFLLIFFLIVNSNAVEIGKTVELYSAIVTAKSCAEKAIEIYNLEILPSCPPVEAAKSGYVIFDVTEGEYYYIKLGKIYLYEFDRAYGENMIIFGIIIGEKDGIPVINPVEYEFRQGKSCCWTGCQRINSFRKKQFDNIWKE